jgi:hypothetical protein
MRALAVMALALAATSVLANQPYAVKSVESEPALDPQASFWLGVEALKLDGMELKAVHSAKSVFVHVQWNCEVESRMHSPWKWDAARKLYAPGDEQEDRLELRWTNGGGIADIWLWRAGRTDPAGFADDLHAAGGSVEFDSGTLCWRQNIPGAFAGAVLPRFVQRTPTESAADVRAKGVWREGRWCVVFARVLDTGNPDDIAFRLNAAFGLELNGRAKTTLVFK